MNIALQCRACNSLDDGNYEAYCDGIVKRYGREYLQEIIQESIRLRRIMQLIDKGFGFDKFTLSLSNDYKRVRKTEL